MVGRRSRRARPRTRPAGRPRHGRLLVRPAARALMRSEGAPRRLSPSCTCCSTGSAPDQGSGRALLSRSRPPVIGDRARRLVLAGVDLRCVGQVRGRLVLPRHWSARLQSPTPYPPACRQCGLTRADAVLRGAAHRRARPRIDGPRAGRLAQSPPRTGGLIGRRQLVRVAGRREGQRGAAARRAKGSCSRSVSAWRRIVRLQARPSQRAGRTTRRGRHLIAGRGPTVVGGQAHAGQGSTVGVRRPQGPRARHVWPPHPLSLPGDCAERRILRRGRLPFHSPG